MTSVTQIVADLTTTAGGGATTYRILKSSTPSTNLAVGESHLQETIDTLEYMLDKRASSGSRPEIRKFRQEHDRLSARGERIRNGIEASWSPTWDCIRTKTSTYMEAKRFAKQTKVLNERVRRSSRTAASQKIKDKIGDVDSIIESEEPSADASTAHKNKGKLQDLDQCKTQTLCEEEPEAGPSKPIRTRPASAISLEPLTINSDILLQPLEGPARLLTSKDSSATLCAPTED